MFSEWIATEEGARTCCGAVLLLGPVPFVRYWRRYPDPFAKCNCRHFVAKAEAQTSCVFVLGRESGENWFDWIRRRHEDCRCLHSPNCATVRHIPPYLAPGDGFVPMTPDRSRWIKHEGSSTQTKDGIPNPDFDALAWRPKARA